MGRVKFKLKPKAEDTCIYGLRPKNKAIGDVILVASSLQDAKRKHEQHLFKDMWRIVKLKEMPL